MIFRSALLLGGGDTEVNFPANGNPCQDLQLVLTPTTLKLEIIVPKLQVKIQCCED